MSCTLEGQCVPIRADVTALIEKRRKLENAIEVAWQCSQSLIRSALAAECARRGSLTLDDELSIRASVGARDRSYLDSLYIDLERVKTQVASLTPAATTQN